MAICAACSRQSHVRCEAPATCPCQHRRPDGSRILVGVDIARDGTSEVAVVAVDDAGTVRRVTCTESLDGQPCTLTEDEHQPYGWHRHHDILTWGEGSVWLEARNCAQVSSPVSGLLVVHEKHCAHFRADRGAVAHNHPDTGAAWFAQFRGPYRYIIRRQFLEPRTQFDLSERFVIAGPACLVAGTSAVPTIFKEWP